MFVKKSPVLENFFEDHGDELIYKKGEPIAWAKDKSEWVYFLVKGYARFCFSPPNGTGRTIAFAAPGFVFAQVGSFFNENDGQTSFFAATDALVYRVPRKLFLSAIADDRDMGIAYRELLSRYQILFVERIVYSGESGLYMKCLRWLMFMHKHYGEKNGKYFTIPIPLTQETIADFLHTTRESVNVILKELKKKKLIAIEKKELTILDLEKIQKLAATNKP